MILLAQLSDALGETTWKALFVVCFAAPLIGLAVRRMRRASIRYSVALVVAYYLSTLASFAIDWAFRGESAVAALGFLLILASGLIVGFVVAFGEAVGRQNDVPPKSE